MDLAFARRDDNESLILLNNGAAEFTARALPNSRGDHRQAILADLTGDGRVDLLLSAIDAESPLFIGDGTGNFTLGGRLGSANEATQALAAADLDGDGDIDIVVGAGETSNGVYFNDGKGTFTALTLDDEAEDTYGVAIGDLDGDGLPDLVFANSQAPNVVMTARRLK